MIGLGVTPEGINQNYIVYDLMLEMSWRSEPQILDAFVDHYIYRRYGDFDNNVSNAWQILKVFTKNTNNNPQYFYKLSPCSTENCLQLHRFAKH